MKLGLLLDINCREPEECFSCCICCDSGCRPNRYHGDLFVLLCIEENKTSRYAQHTTNLAKNHENDEQLIVSSE